MRLYIFIALWVGTSIWMPIFSQTNNSVSPTGIIREIPLKHKLYTPSNNVPELYIYETWATGDFTTIDGIKAKDHLIKYELLNEWLEVKVGGIVKLLPLENLKEFTWTLTGTQSVERYINGNVFQFRGLPAEGVFKVLYDGETQLLEKIAARLIKANYNPLLEAGNREDTYSHSLSLMLAKDGKLTLIPNKKKHIVELFSPYASQVETFIKQEKIKIRQTNGLVRVVSYYDELLVNGNAFN